MSKRKVDLDKRKVDLENLSNESDLQKFLIDSEKGYGVKTKKFIPKGNLIVEYKGTFGLKKDNLQNVDNGWTFSLRHLEKDYVLNAFGVDGLGKYLNHSFDSNVMPVKDLTLSIPRIYFKALRDIQEGEGKYIKTYTH